MTLSGRQYRSESVAAIHRGNPSAMGTLVDRGGVSFEGMPARVAIMVCKDPLQKLRRLP